MPDNVRGCPRVGLSTRHRSPCRTTVVFQQGPSPYAPAMSPNEPTGTVLRSSLVTLASGVVLVGAYFVLKAFDVVGQPSDIGGGLILLAGYVLTAVGAVLVGRDLLRYRSSRP